ncbi:MAG: hypothetical protein ACQESN_05500 [Thermotogota bacterium]
MKCFIKETEQDLLFCVGELSQEEQKFFKGELFEKNGDYYTKKFSNKLKNIETTAKNFERNGCEMYEYYLGSERKNPMKKLLEVAEILNRNEINWFLSGSTAAKIYGVEINPKDINIVVDLKDLEKIQDLFKEKIIIPVEICEDWIAKGYGIMFDEIPVDFVFEVSEDLDKPDPIDCGPYAWKHLNNIDINEKTIPVPEIKLLYNINKRRNREERASLIKEKM